MFLQAPVPQPALLPAVAQQMSDYESATIALTTWLVILTGVYVIGTLALFWVTYRQTRQQMRGLQYQALLNIVNTNRELLSIALNHPELLRFFSQHFIGNKEDQALHRYAQMWLNFAEVTWYSHHTGILADEVWKPLKPDLYFLFNEPVMREQWERIKHVYEEEFITEVDTFLKEKHQWEEHGKKQPSQ
jgi:hypothetical protein